MNANLAWGLFIVAAYLAGSIPFGLLIGLARGIDIRQHGSKNIGATNAGRVLGKPWGLACFSLDVLKGAAPVALVGWYSGAASRASLPTHEAALWIGVACAAVLGHMHSIFLGFKGGKGVATGFGVLLGLYGYLAFPALIALAIWLAVVRVTHYVSVGSCVAAGSIPISLLAFTLGGASSRELSTTAAIVADAPFLILTFALSGLVIWKHRANIARLRAGTENRVWVGARAQSPHNL